MRVRISYTVEVGDDYRRAIRAFYGKDGLATREEVRAWVQRYGDSMDDDLMRGTEDEELAQMFDEAPEGNPATGNPPKRRCLGTGGSDGGPITTRHEGMA